VTSHRRVVLAALAACAQLPAGARAQDCTVAGLSGVDNGLLGAACQPFQTLSDGTSCNIACLTGYARSGAQPSCSGGVFEPGSITCTGLPCLTDPPITGIASTLSECEDLDHGAVCEFYCTDGLQPSGTTTCDAGNYGAATCDEINACINFPCALPVSETCVDRLASDGGLDDVAGRVCTGNPCNAESTGSLAGRGYTAATPTATTVTGLGQIGCASGYMRAGDRSVAPTATCSTSDAGQTPGQFEFAGCVESACSGIPTFLEGFDLTGVTLPPRPADAAVSGLNTCQDNRLPSGSVALTVKCDLNGDYQQENSVADDKVCAPCTAVDNAAVEACAYAIPPVPPIGTAPLSAEATTARIELCAAVDISGSDPAADETACESASGGGVCTYIPVATYTCTTPTDSRVSACKPGYYKTVGMPDVVETVNTVESTNDVCTPCVAVENAARGSIVTCTTVYDTRVSGCAAEHYRSQGVTERCDGATEGDTTDDACEALVLDGQPVTCTGAAAPARPCSHTEGTSDTCEACGRVVDALEGAVQNCTNANDTRVESCRNSYVLVRGAGGAAPVPDTCWSTPPSVALTYDGDFDAVTGTPAAFTSFESRFKRDLGDFLTIPTRRIVVTSVAKGSIVVYFYLLAAAASAPLNEYSPSEAYAELTATASSGTLALLFPGAAFTGELVMPVDVPVGYQPPPPPPPPVVCSEVVDREECLAEGCGW
jgi:hypothetical protein